MSTGNPERETAIKGLLVEDDALDTMLLLRLLAEPGWPSFKFAIECAETLQAALGLLAKQEYDVVILDFGLPDSYGLETLLKVRAQAPDIPVVVLTGMSDEAVGLKAIAHGAQDYQVKGHIDGHAFRRTVSFAVQRHRMLGRLRAMVEKAADAMLVLDPKRTILYANPAANALLGRGGEPLTGRPFPYALPTSSDGELRLGGDSGERIAEVRLTDIEWSDGPATLASIRDITDLRRVEQLKAEIGERRRMDKLKDELMSAVSHEIRSPLAIVKAAIGNLKEGLVGPLSSQQTPLVLLADRNIRRLEKIVNNILDLSRLEAGLVKLSPETLDLGRFLRDSIRGFHLLAGEEGIAIHEDIPARLPSIRTDAELLTQVLGNLIDNALRFAKGTIRVGARAGPAEPGEEGGGRAGERGERLVLSVADDGPGIPQERIPELFSKFVQLSRTSKKGGYKGTGLGLAICKEIVQRLGGRIWVSSREGEGACFRVSLPLSLETPPAREERHVAQ